MERIKQQVVLLRLLTALRDSGSWCGETHIQKCAYLAQHGLNVPFDFQFVLYRHGPFSFDLRQLLGEMRANLLIVVQPQDPYGPSISPGPSAAALESTYPKSFQMYANELDRIAQKYGRMRVVELERLSTALYVVRERPSASRDEQAARVHELKPHISNAEASSALSEVTQLLEGH